MPLNYILLALFTFSFSFLVAFYTVPYEAAVVLQSGGATALTTIALTVYAWRTDEDHTICGGLLYILPAAMTMLILSFALFSPSTLYAPFVCALLVVFYGLFLVIDTQIIAG